MLGILFITHCGLWISNPWVEFSSVHARSWPLLYFVGCVMLPSHYISELCVLLAEFSLFWNCGLFPSFIVSLGCWYTLVWVLLLSCFGHVRAKNNSMLSVGLELCSSFVWDYPWLSFHSSQGCEGIVLLCVSSGWSLDCAGLTGCWWLDKPRRVGLADGVPRLCVSLRWPLSLEESCPAGGLQFCWEIDEHTGLWLGGTL